MRKPDEANHVESVDSITVSVGYKLTIRDVMHYFKKECISSNNEKLLSFLFRRVIVEATAMKKAHEKFTPALMNLIQKAQCVLKIEIVLNNKGLL